MLRGYLIKPVLTIYIFIKKKKKSKLRKMTYSSYFFFSYQLKESHYFLGNIIIFSFTVLRLYRGC